MAEINVRPSVIESDTDGHLVRGVVGLFGLRCRRAGRYVNRAAVQTKITRLDGRNLFPHGNSTRASILASLEGRQLHGRLIDLLACMYGRATIADQLLFWDRHQWMQRHRGRSVQGLWRSLAKTDQQIIDCSRYVISTDGRRGRPSSLPRAPGRSLHRHLPARRRRRRRQTIAVWSLGPTRLKSVYHIKTDRPACLPPAAH